MLKRNLIIAVIFIAVLFAVRASAQDATFPVFSNTTPITINDNGIASLYPSGINVRGVSSRVPVKRERGTPQIHSKVLGEFAANNQFTNIEEN